MDSFRPRQHSSGGIVKTELFRRLEIYHQLELCRLLDRQVGRLGTFKNFVDVDGGTAVTLPRSAL